jgi:hypothetical protein
VGRAGGIATALSPATGLMFAPGGSEPLDPGQPRPAWTRPRHIPPTYLSALPATATARPTVRISVSPLAASPARRSPFAFAPSPTSLASPFSL